MKWHNHHMGIFHVLTLWAFLLMGSGNAPCASNPNPEELLKKANHCRDALYRSSNKMKLRHHWMHCINTYKKIYIQHPDSDQARWAMYHEARMYQGLYRYSGWQQDLDESIQIFRKLVATYPEHRLADDAQYRIGELYYAEKKEPTQAYVEFLKVDIKFPTGDMRPKARRMMDKLAVTISKKEQEEKKETVSGHQMTQVKDIRHWSTPTYTRVVVDLEQAVEYESHLLEKDPTNKKPRRLYLDLNNTYVSADIESPIPIRDGLLQRARAGQYTNDTVRVVLDINSIGGYKVFRLHDPFRIVVDVRGVESKEIAKTEKSIEKKRPARQGIRKVRKPDKTVSLARQLGLSVKRIVIDPGHGGKDPGCFLRGGIKEKDIVLELAKKLANKIEQTLGCEVILTRTKDTFISLEKRTAFANMKKADLFISLHINAHHLKSVRGVETYYLNIATDSRAVMVAARENATSEKNISDLQTILNDLMLNTKITESNKLAHEVQSGMIGQLKKKYKRIKSLGVKQAPFYVLIGADMPAILVETGFITNPTDRQRLLSRNYQEKLADGIVSGIHQYIKSINQMARIGG